MKKTQHIFFSIILHLTIVGLFVFVISEKQINSVDDTPIISVEITRPENKPAGGQSTKSSSVHKISLFPKINFSKVYEQSAFGNNSKPISKYALSDDRLFDSDLGDIFGENNNQNWDFYRAVYHKIDQHLIFDSMLAQFRHFGNVKVQFTVTSLGLIDFQNIQIIAADPILKVHTLRALKKALSQPLEINKRLKTGSSIVIQSQFNFKYADPSFNFEKQNNFGSKKFIFNRATLEKPIPEDLLSHLASGGVTPNISLMIERWQKYNRHKDWKKFQFDPFIDYKSDPFYDL